MDEYHDADGGDPSGQTDPDGGAGYGGTPGS